MIVYFCSVGRGYVHSAANFLGDQGMCVVVCGRVGVVLPPDALFQKEGIVASSPPPLSRFSIMHPLSLSLSLFLTHTLFVLISVC